MLDDESSMLITAIASSAAENLDLYEKVLGLRLVKKTVNLDDPYTYALYYGDAAGAAGHHFD